MKKLFAGILVALDGITATYARRASLAILAGAIMSASAVHAQITSGEIVGTVTDPSNAVVTNASVHAVNTQTNVGYDATTNSTGEYRFSNLPVGFYNITATAPGFGTLKSENFEVQLNKVSTDNLQLKAATSSNVEVTAQAAVALDQTTSQLQNTFEAKELTDLPTSSSNVINLSLLAPGVSSGGGTGIGVGPSVGGQRPQNNDFQLEGIDNNNKTVSGPQVYVPNDAVAELTVLTNLYTAEYGHSDAGHFNTIVTSGTNKFHGKLYEYFQNRNLNAVDFATVRGGGPSKNPRFDNNRFGGQIGGPILKDKLFFFVNYERNPIGNTGGVQTLCTPTADGIATINAQGGLSATNVAQFEKYAPRAPGNVSASGTCLTLSAADFNPKTQNPVYAGIADTPANRAKIGSPQTAVNGQLVATGDNAILGPAFTNNDALVTSIDWTIGPKDSFRGRYIYNLSDTIDTAAPLPVFQGATPNRFHLATLSEFHTFTPNLTNEFRVGYNRNYALVGAIFPAAYPAYNGTFPNLQFDNDLGQFNIGPDPNAPQGGIQNTYQAVDNIIWVKGRHTMKFGFDGRKFISPQSFVQRVRGDYQYSSLDVFLHDNAPDDFGERDANQFGTVPTDYGDATSFAGYAQDDYRIRPNLTLNFGVRYEFTSVSKVLRLQALNAPASVPGLLNFKEPKPQYLNFGPRVGFNYALDNNTTIRGGFGLAYDQIRDNLSENEAPPDVAITTDVGPNTPNLTNFLATGGLPNKASLATVADRIAHTATFIPDQKLPYAESYSLGVQHVFHQNYTAEVRYVGTHGVHLVTQTQLNRQSVINQNFNLPTFFSQPSPATINSLTTTLKQINAAAANNAAIPTAFLNAGFTSKITSYQNFGGSLYNGVSGQLTRRFQDGLLLNFAYTYSKNMDNSTSDVNSIALTPRRSQDFFNYNSEWSRSALDHTNRFTAVAVYDLPYFKHSSFLVRNLLGNFEVAPVYTYESPEYFTPLSAVTSNLNGDSSSIDRTIINPAGKKGNKLANTSLTAPVKNANGDTVAYVALNPDAYYVQARVGSLPNAARNTEPTRPINNLDMNVIKRVSFTERYSAEVQVISYNLLNHPQFIPGSINSASLPVSTAGAANFNRLSSPIYGDPKQTFNSNARQLTVAAKFIF